MDFGRVAKPLQPPPTVRREVRGPYSAPKLYGMTPRAIAAAIKASLVAHDREGRGALSPVDFVEALLDVRESLGISLRALQRLCFVEDVS